MALNRTWTENYGANAAPSAPKLHIEMGCNSDWAPDCLKSQLTDPDGDGTYTFTTAIPAGTWEVKATVGQSAGQQGKAVSVFTKN